MKTFIRRRAIAITAIAAAAIAVVSGCASLQARSVPEPATVRVNVFRGASNLPIYMARELGAYDRQGIKLELQFTPDSVSQRAGLPAGKFDLAVTAVDNAVAMVESAKQDVIIVSGGDGGMNEFMVRPEIMRPADVRGRAYVVDAPNTAFALIGRKILKDAGLAEGRDYRLHAIGGSEARAKAFEVPENAAALLSPPWNFIARDSGAKSLGSTIDLYGRYQSGGIAVMRQWANANRPVLERYLAAHIEGCRAARDPAMRTRAIAVLQRDLKLTPALAEASYQELVKPHGITPDCALDIEGFRNMLSLRAEIEGQWGGKAPEPGKFLDLSYYERALKLAGR
jgi:ABC-type nitrate/sulfonate/bicarbonate transport system substrate-binding protein